MLKATSTISTRIPYKATDNSYFLTLNTKSTFSQLRQAFIEALILYYFDSKYYIKIKIDASNYVIYDILSYLTFNYK